ncbi:hypothetical protein HSB1_39120 [Halogranum salarium B-1]|uniref:Uncharacterized protein n=2 Tax=Halogranum rubrum TaxID=553466 RepID=J3JDJ8_9EURY|nr:hypothetical protein HSB1_39120 [Halogranum salarium B-1]
MELTAGGRGLVSEAFLNDEATLTEEDLGPYLQHTGIEVDLTPLTDEIERIKRDHEANDAKIDQRLAPEIHQALDLSRREASIDGIWHYLTIIEYPEFVHHRWKGTSDIRGKFLDGGTNIYSNALHRLWWIAEITCEGDDYHRTREIFEMQELANDIADRWFARYQPVTYACVDVLKKEEIEDFAPANTKIVSNATKELRERLSVTCAEGLTYEDAKALVKEIRTNTVDDLS